MTSVYNQSFDGTLDEELREKILFDGFENANVKHLKTPNFVNILKTAVDNSDAVVMGGDDVPEELQDYIKKLNKPVLPYTEKENFSHAYQEFYDTKVLSES